MGAESDEELLQRIRDAMPVWMEGSVPGQLLALVKALRAEADAVTPDPRTSGWPGHGQMLALAAAKRDAADRLEAILRG